MTTPDTPDALAALRVVATIASELFFVEAVLPGDKITPEFAEKRRELGRALKAAGVEAGMTIEFAALARAEAAAPSVGRCDQRPDCSCFPGECAKYASPEHEVEDCQGGCVHHRLDVALSLIEALRDALASRPEIPQPSEPDAGRAALAEEAVTVETGRHEQGYSVCLFGREVATYSSSLVAESEARYWRRALNEYARNAALAGATRPGEAPMCEPGGR